MILVIKAIKSEFNKKLLQKCIIKNLTNHSIDKLYLFTDSEISIDNKKVIIINKISTDSECVRNVTLLNPNKIIIWTKWNIILDNKIIKYNNITPKDCLYIKDSDNIYKLIIFNSINFYKINSEVFFCIKGKKIEIVEEKVYTELDIPKLDISKIELENKLELNTIKKIGNKYTTPSIYSTVEKLDTIIVSVDYNDTLILCLKNNIKYLSNFTIVTSTKDTKCKEICDSFGINCIVTDVMYENDAYFNKGKAINEGIKSLKDPSWILIMDADIMLTEPILNTELENNTIYTANRYHCLKESTLKKWKNNEIELKAIGDYEHDAGYGFFQLFNWNSNKINKNKVYPEKYVNASMSDMDFYNLFSKKETLTTCIHLGRSGKNWNGRKTEPFTNNIENQIEIEKNLTILYPPTINWNLLFQRPQQLMKNFSNVNGVTSIFWNSRGDKKQSKDIESPSSRLYIVDQFKKIEEFSFLFNGKKILWFSHPSHHYLSEIIKWDLVVFDAIDNPVDEFSEWSIDLSEAVRKSDIIFASAKVMYDDHKKTGKPVYMLPNGSDFELFEKSKNKLDKPSDFPDIEGPIIGYYGAMASWLDWEIVKKLSTKYKIVMIGGNKYYNEKIDSENIYYLDHKKIEELPYYLSNFDIPIIPFKLTEMIKGCDPIKFYEYITSGKPVVVTEMEELKRFQDICYFMNYENCIDIVEMAINENNQELKNKRIEISRENSWSIRSLSAIEKIRKHL